ncbi:MAG TPA: peptidylprolyl isomerase [Candidatus Thermoplasmatota archaeon]|jgi:peptidylprolyl isomerase|nr:peptidylprolyl isomerase [Candidatus Thermoplasmatota archaeon]
MPAPPGPEHAAQATDKAVEQGDTVRVHYVGRLEDESVFDTSDGREPLQFEAGAGDVIPGFDEGVMGMRVGETRRIVIPPEEGYGPWRPDLLAQVDRAMAGDQEVLPGMSVQVRTPEDEIMEGTITEVSEESLTLDFNHPLAGKVLTFEVTVVEIEEPRL